MTSPDNESDFHQYQQEEAEQTLINALSTTTPDLAQSIALAAITFNQSENPLHIWAQARGDEEPPAGLHTIGNPPHITAPPDWRSAGTFATLQD